MNESIFVVQALVVAIGLGVYYSLHVSTRVYGGLVGRSLRYFGIGMLFVTITALERIFINFGVFPNTLDLTLLQDILNLIGLVFLGLGFSKLASANKL